MNDNGLSFFLSYYLLLSIFTTTNSPSAFMPMRIYITRGDTMQKESNISRAFTWLEPGPVILVTTNNGKRNNVCTISWHMVMDFSPHIAITTGNWNQSFDTILHTRECVLCIPGLDLLDDVLYAGMHSGTKIDKFARLHLTALQGNFVKAPLIEECLACIECKLESHIETYGILIFKGLQLWENKGRKENRTAHAVGDGSFISDGHIITKYRKNMRTKIPDGCTRF